MLMCRRSFPVAQCSVMSVLYSSAAEVLRKLDKRQGSLKSLVFSCQPVSLRKKIYALVSNTIKHKVAISSVIEGCDLLQKEPHLPYHLALVAVYDLLFGKGLQGGGAVKRHVMAHKTELKDCLCKVLQQSSELEMCEISLPRYARVNCLKTTVEKVVMKLEQDGFSLVSHSTWFEEYWCCKTQHSTGRDTHKHFCMDADVPDLLVFCSCVSLAKHELYTASDIILQDKASCLPAFLLAPPPGSHVVDTCAAPGNKTTHLASIMSNTGVITAFDKSKERYSTLVQLVEQTGASCVHTVCGDFLQTVPADYPLVEYILVDPSCSGSGIANRVEYHSKGRVDLKRIKSLSKFQCKILKHALSFPSTLRVVYSTCSVHEAENELVVQTALAAFGDKFELVHVLPQWNRRGLPLFTHAENCLRATPEGDATNGFFVAVFQRVESTPKSSKGGISLSMQSSKGTTACGEMVASPSMLRPAKSHRSKKRRKRKRNFPVNM